MAQVRGITAQLDLCVIESDDAQCNACTFPILRGNVAVLSPGKDAICCWQCAGQQLAAAVQVQPTPLIVM
jgi:hypothetical protein